MEKKCLRLLSFLVFITFGTLFSQEKQAPDYKAQGVFLGKSEPLRDLPTIKEPRIKKSSEARIIRNRLRAKRKVNKDALPLYGEKQAQRNLGGIASFAPEENFDGATIAEGGALPPDPTGAAGPNHYVHGFNLGIKIFDKSGNLLMGPVTLGDFFNNGVNDGDPIILYDQLEDRFFISQFRVANNALLIAISETPDPTGAYFLYEFPLDAFPDYPHYSIWPDGYYMTTNKFFGNTTYVLERDVLLTGSNNPEIVGFNLPGIANNPNTVLSPEPSNLLGTEFNEDTPGYITYLQDDGWGGIGFDHLKVWEIEMDWDNPDGSTISQPLEIPVMPFEATFAPFGTGDVAQPGTNQKIDMIGGVISYMVNYRVFDDYNAMTITFNVDVDGNDTSGIRWIELRNNDTDDWEVFQEGTYAPDDGHSRFMGSMAMDSEGNLGLAFNIASENLPAGMRYTGRFADDPLGEMTVEETTIIDGIGVQTISNRFGDYSHLTLDPDNLTFWFTGEYFSGNNSWTTRIASFKIAGEFENDIGISNILSPEDGILSNAEEVEVIVRNFGTEPQSNISVELYLDGNLEATESFSGTVNPGETQNYTFSETLDLSTVGQTYSIAAKTNLPNDEFVNNDEFTKEVTHMVSDDVGITNIVNPSTGEGLGNETITVIISNFGNVPQNNFDVSYTINDGSPIVETVTEEIETGEELIFSFNQQGDFSELGSHTIEASTLLTNDEDISNDSFEITIENEACGPTGNCDNGDGITRFSIGTIDNETECSPNGYGDFTGLNTNILYDSEVEITVQSGLSDQLFSVWIDFNDNMVFEENERVVFDFPVPNADTNFVTSFNLTDDTSILGAHLMRVRAGWADSEGTIDNPCIDFTWGETEDYSITIVDELSINQQEFYNSNLSVYPTENNTIYEVLFETPSDFGEMNVMVHNILGQKIMTSSLDKTSLGYTTELDFSSLSSGAYLVKVYSKQFSTVKRILVK